MQLTSVVLLSALLAAVAQAAPSDSWSSESDLDISARDTFNSDLDISERDTFDSNLSLPSRGVATAEDMLYHLARDVDGVQEWLEARGAVMSAMKTPEQRAARAQRKANKKEAKRQRKERAAARNALEGNRGRRQGGSPPQDYRQFAQGPAGQFVNRPRQGGQVHSLQMYGHA